MAEEKNWRFPNNGYGEETGIDSTDVETFKKDPEGALAREIGQNSIDAKCSDATVRIEYKLFMMKRKDIPGIDRLTGEITRCYEYKKNSEKEAEPLKFMLDSIKRDIIPCLRISDFNTSGLQGVHNGDNDAPFYLITKASGVSNKEGSKGGSKGIGKFATFVNSSINTVFYSTKTLEGECGYLGVAKLRSAPLNKEGLLTQGKGYYSDSERNTAIIEEINFDKNFKRTESGTDIYIMGFNNHDGWENDIICKTLDSFMAAIVFGNLEVKVENTVLNKETLSTIVEKEDIYKNRGKLEKTEIIAQYDLLTGKDVVKEDIPIFDYGTVTFYAKKYTKETENRAMKRRVMIRYPYMKIKHNTGDSFLPYSAICIIHDDDVNYKLRKIENAQHTDWEIKRLHDINDRKTTRKILDEIDMKFAEFLETVLTINDAQNADMEGAGEYLPSLDNGDNTHKDETVEETRVTSAVKRQKVSVQKTSKTAEDFETLEFDSGTLDEDGDGQGRGLQNSDSPDPSNNEHDVDNTEGVSGGETPLLKKTALSGMKYKNIVVDKNAGIYDIVFTSIYDEDNCDLELKLCGEGNDTYRVDIEKATCNSKECTVKNGKVIDIIIEKDKKYRIRCFTNKKSLFSSEVILNAYRK